MRASQWNSKNKKSKRSEGTGNIEKKDAPSQTTVVLECNALEHRRTVLCWLCNELMNDRYDENQLEGLNSVCVETR